MATVTTPVWVKMQDNGSYTLCPADEAQGVVLDGTVYHVDGTPELTGVETVVVGEISEAAYQKEQQEIIRNKAEQAEVDAIAAAIERGLSL